MAKRIGGVRRKTRHKLSKPSRAKGKLSLRKYFQTFENGDKVQLHAEPSIQKGAYFYRFHGIMGIVVGQRGKAYIVEIKDGKKTKEVIVAPVHLKRL